VMPDPRALPPLPTEGGPRSSALRDRVDARAGADESKQDPTTVNYRPAEGAQTCGSCRHFIPDQTSARGTCDLVAGAIDPQWTCDLFEGADETTGGLLPEATPAMPPVGGM
jgi:hypothetical protein